MRLLDEIAVLLGVYKLRILAVGDCLTDISPVNSALDQGIPVNRSCLLLLMTLQKH